MIQQCRQPDLWPQPSPVVSTLAAGKFDGGFGDVTVLLSLLLLLHVKVFLTSASNQHYSFMLEFATVASALP